MSGLAGAVALAACVWVGWVWLGPSPRATVPMVQEAYVWQRAWTPTVRQAVAEHDGRLSRLVVLGAEVSWDKGQPRVAEAGLDYPSLLAARDPIGLALRVGAYNGSFEEDKPACQLLVKLCMAMMQKARDAGLTVAEFQVDFDCPRSRLADYALWVKALKKVVAPVPLTITALPNWLDHGHFRELAAETDGFVLQVHSLHRPESIDDPITLCDPNEARIEVELAGRMDKPFRVALPTYGYMVGFDPSGHFVGISSEGPAPQWSSEVEVRPVRSDPVAMAELVRAFAADRPVNMTGIIWYRLPTQDDRLNWRAVTLATVMSGEAPKRELAAQARQTGPGLYEVEIVNAGQASAPLKVSVTAQWIEAKLLSADAIGGFERSSKSDTEIVFAALPEAAMMDLAPGEKKVVGWFRLSEDKEIQVDVTPNE